MDILLYLNSTCNYFGNEKGEVLYKGFSRKQLLNKEESKVFCQLKKLEYHFDGLIHVFPQTNLGEFIKAFRDFDGANINSKRADFLICSHNFWPIAVIEYHGGGHFQGDWELRDRIKEEACKKANIIYRSIYEAEINCLEVPMNFLKSVIPNAVSHYKKSGIF